jgi:pantoate kinase
MGLCELDLSIEVQAAVKQIVGVHIEIAQMMREQATGMNFITRIRTSGMRAMSPVIFDPAVENLSRAGESFAEIIDFSDAFMGATAPRAAVVEALYYNGGKATSWFQKVIKGFTEAGFQLVKVGLA